MLLREGVLISADVLNQCCSKCLHSLFLLLRSSSVAWLLLAAPLVVAFVAAVMLATAVAQETSFSCQDRPYGYYADVEADCQVFHICNNNAKWSFRCPNQTLFNQVRLSAAQAHLSVAVTCCIIVSTLESDGKYGVENCNISYVNIIGISNNYSFPIQNCSSQKIITNA